MTQKTISKSKLKPRLLEILQDIERTRKEIIITDHGKPVLKILPYTQNDSGIVKTLRRTVIKYENPTDSVDASWDALT